MTHKRIKRHFWGLAVAAVFLVCLGLFLINAFDVVTAFWNQDSNLGTVHQEHEKLALPEIMICPVPSTKPDHDPKMKSSPNEEEFRNATYNFEDLFMPGQEKILSKVFSFTEYASMVMGRCYKSVAIEVNSNTIGTSIRLYKNLSYTVYLYSPGNEIWLWSQMFPIRISNIELPKVSEEIKGHGVDLHMTKKINVVQSRGKNCQNYPSPDLFAKCAKSLVSNYIMNNITCKHHLFDSLLETRDPAYLARPLCVGNAEQQRPHALSMVLLLFMTFVSKPNSFGCLLPCSKEEYVVNPVPFEPGIDNVPMRYLGLMYESTTVEITSEVPIYNVTRLIGGIGGSLGLYLGFSFFGVLKDVIKMLKGFMKEKKKSHNEFNT